MFCGDVQELLEVLLKILDPTFKLLVLVLVVWLEILPRSLGAVKVSFDGAISCPGIISPPLFGHVEIERVCLVVYILLQGFLPLESGSEPVMLALVISKKLLL